MMHLFADDNYLKKHTEGTLTSGGQEISYEFDEEYFTYGGVAMGTADRLKADELLASVKAQHGVPTYLPIKWNLKDPRVRDFYERHGQLAAHERMCGPEMDTLRDELFDGLTGFKVLRVFGVIVEKKHSEKLGRDIREMAFVNLLQRVGAFKKWKAGPANTAARVVLDYPDREMGNLPFDVYHDAYAYGRDRYGNEFSCGPLAGCGFEQGLLYGNTNTSPMLQLADMVAGSTADFFQWALKGGPRKRVDRFFTKLLPLFHRTGSGDIIPWGLCPSTDRNEHIGAKLKEIEAAAVAAVSATPAPADQAPSGEVQAVSTLPAATGTSGEARADGPAGPKLPGRGAS
jgi:hypothetical protein